MVDPYSIYYIIAFMVISYALTPKPPKPQPAAIQELSDVPVAKEGTPVPVVFGELALKAPNVVWYGNKSVDAIKSDGGGK